jgi:hypothetical protein
VLIPGNKENLILNNKNMKNNTDKKANYHQNKNLNEYYNMVNKKVGENFNNTFKLETKYFLDEYQEKTGKVDNMIKITKF